MLFFSKNLIDGKKRNDYTPPSITLFRADKAFLWGYLGIICGEEAAR
jgi:hypothetical protein